MDNKTQPHPELIKAYIRMKGKTLSDLARENNVDTSTVQLALKKPSKKGECIIANFLNVPLYQLWPDRWTKSGQRIRPRYRNKYT